MMTNNTLYRNALAADERYAEVIRRNFPGKDRWSLTTEEQRLPEVLDAYYLKIEADREWLTFLRTQW